MVAQSFLIKSLVITFLFTDYEGMCRSLTEKERQLNDIKDRNEEKLEQMKREYTAERLRLEQDKTTAEQERDLIKYAQKI